MARFAIRNLILTVLFAMLAVACGSAQYVHHYIDAKGDVVRVVNQPQQHAPGKNAFAEVGRHFTIAQQMDMRAFSTVQSETNSKSICGLSYFCGFVGFNFSANAASFNRAMRPSGPTRKVTRLVPMNLRPMKLFSPQTP